MSNCHDDILCPVCHEHTTRHEPCCPGTPQCECIECKGCGELAPDWEDGVCRKCWSSLERVEAAETAKRDYEDWRRS